MNHLLLSSPHLASREVLVERFLLRHELLQKVLASLDSPEPQHWLLSGLRGMGKTSLLLRLASAISADSKLAVRFLPLEFPEELHVAQLSRFYVTCLESLAESLKRSGHETDAKRLLQITADPERRTDAEEMLKVLIAEAQRLERTFVLLLDNAERVLDRIGKDGSRLLAKALEGEPRLLLIAATSNPFAPCFARRSVFERIFRRNRLELQPITFDEAHDLFHKLAGLLNNSVVTDWLLKSQPRRLQVLHRLSGGNLRTLLTLFEAVSVSRRGGVKEDIDKFLDMASERYKAQLEFQGPQAQRILAAIADKWPYMQTARDIAEELDESVNSVSAQLAKLSAAGLITKGPKRRSPQDFALRETFWIPERLWALWLLLRNRREATTQVYAYAELLQALDDPRETGLRMLSDRAAGRSADDVKVTAAAISDPKLRWSVRELGRRRDGKLRDASDAARELWEKCDFERCAQVCSKALEADPQDVRVLNMQACCLIATGKLAEAESVLHTAVELVPTFSAAQRNLGLIYKYRELWSEAEQALLRAADAEDPEDACSALDSLVEVYWHPKVARYADAEITARKALDKRPQDPNALWNLSYLLAQHLGRPEEGLQVLQDALLRSKANNDVETQYTVLTNLGSMLTDQEAFEAAEKYLTEAIALDAKRSHAWHLLGLLHAARKSYAQALEHYNRAIEADGTNAVVRETCAFLLLDEFDAPDAAEAHFRRATQLRPWSADMWGVLGWFLQAHRDNCVESEQALRRALQLDASNDVTWFNIGVALEMQNRHDEALDAFCRALELNPQDAKALEAVRSQLLRGETHAPQKERVRRAALRAPATLGLRELLLELAAKSLRSSGWEATRELLLSALAPEQMASIQAELGAKFQAIFLPVAVAEGAAAKCIELLNELRLDQAWTPIREALVAIDDPGHIEQLVPEVRGAARSILLTLGVGDIDAAAAKGDSEEVRRLMRLGSPAPVLWTRKRVSEIATFLEFTEVTEQSVAQPVANIESRLVSKPRRRRLSTAPIAFAPGFRLLAIESLDALGQNEQFALLRPDGGSQLLDWTNEPVYDMVDTSFAGFEPEHARLYCQFMFMFVRGQFGRFVFVDNVDAMPWKGDVDADIRRKVTERLQPLRFKEQTQDFIRFTGTVLFKNALFATDVTLAKSELQDSDSDPWRPRQWRMENEQLLLEELPVFVDGPPGVFG